MKDHTAPSLWFLPKGHLAFVYMRIDVVYNMTFYTVHISLIHVLVDLSAMKINTEI